MLDGKDITVTAAAVGFIGSIFKVSNKFQDHTNRLDFLEKSFAMLREDTKYIRDRLDEISDK